MDADGNDRHRLCGGLFGCGDDGARAYMVAPEAVEETLTPRTRDRLDRMDELNREALEPYVASYRVSRRRLVGVGGFLGLLATVAPASLLTACSALRSHGASLTSGDVSWLRGSDPRRPPWKRLHLVSLPNGGSPRLTSRVRGGYFTGASWRLHALCPHHARPGPLPRGPPRDGSPDMRQFPL